MNRALRYVKTGVLLTGFICFVGCGASNVKRDLLSIELEAQQDQVQQLQAIADTMTNRRTRMYDDLTNMIELSGMTEGEVTALKAQASPRRESIIDSIKKLWPF